MLAKKKPLFLLVGPAFLIAQNMVAQAASNNEHPVILEDLINCGTIIKDKDRLACYDKNISTFQSAAEQGEIIVEDKEVILKSREEVFGLKSADTRLFNGDNDASLKAINSTIKSAKQLKTRKWIFYLENGSIWQQIEIKRLRSGGPKGGVNILIKKSGFGGFIAKIDGQRPFRVKRLK